jgi:hypothetical protein
VPRPEQITRRTSQPGRLAGGGTAWCGPQPALALAASHPWDGAGARTAGPVSASANRSVPMAGLLHPTVTGHDLTGVLAPVVGVAQGEHG